MAGSRKALIVATYEYADQRLARLRAPQHDAEALSEVLGDPGIGGFEVETVVNAPWHQVARAVARLFKDRRSDDLALLHVSGHGLKDDTGELYFAATDTDLDLLEATALSSSTVNRLMDRTRAGRVLLFLDCCYAGAFARGMTSRAGGAVDINERLGGRGRAVLTASSALQFAFEPDGGTAGQDDPSPSVFTSALVRGLRTGEADRDLDGWVSLDELYGYLHDEVTQANPNQTPKKWTFDIEGDLYVARRGAPVTTPAELPREVRASMRSMLTWEREAAVHPLLELLGGDHPGLALAARMALQDMAEGDDSSRVRTAAQGALAATTEEGLAPAPAVPAPRQPPASAPDPATEPTEPTEPTGEGWADAATTVPGATAVLPVLGRHMASDDARATTPAMSAPGDAKAGGGRVGDAKAAPRTTRRPTAPAPGPTGVPATRRPADPAAKPASQSRARGWFSLRQPNRPPSRGVVVAGALVMALVAAAAVWAASRLGGDPGSDSGGDSRGESQPRLADSDVVLARTLADGSSALVKVDVDTNATRVLVGDPKAKLPSISPDRTMFTYLVSESRTENVPYLARADGSDVRPLLLGRDSADCPTTTRPAWNPAGDRLAVVCTAPDGRSTGLWLADLGGSSASLNDRLVRSDRLVGAPSWGWDGQIYYAQTTDPANPDARTELWHVAADGKGREARVAYDSEYSYSHPDWSKYGLLFLQSSPGSEEGRVAVLTPDGDTETPEGSDALRSPTWGADVPMAAALGPSQEDPGRVALWTFDASSQSKTMHEVPVDGEVGVPAWGTR